MVIKNSIALYIHTPLHFAGYKLLRGFRLRFHQCRVFTLLVFMQDDTKPTGRISTDLGR